MPPTCAASDDSALVSKVDELRSDLAHADELVASVDDVMQMTRTTAEKTDDVLDKWNTVKGRRWILSRI